MRRVGDEPALTGMGLADRAQRPGREDPGRDANEDDDEQVANHQGEPDPLDRGLVGDLGGLLVRELRADVEGGRQDRREADVEDDAEHAEDEREQRDVEDREPDPRSPEHQAAAPARRR